MKTFTRILALTALATALGASVTTDPAEARGFRGGKGGGHHFGGHTFNGHKFGGHKLHHLNFGYGHRDCWKLGKWICGPRGY